MKRSVVWLVCLMTAFCLMTGCGKEEAEQKQTQKETVAEEKDSDEDYSTGDASLDLPRNEDAIGDKELMVVSFGTSFNDSRRLTIGAIENALEEAFPEWSVRRGFTSQIIIDHVKNRDGVAIDHVSEALERAVNNNVKQLVIQPTHLMNGLEYDELKEEVMNYADGFEQIVIGNPLLTDDEDFRITAEAIIQATEKYDDGKTAIVFMGHGTTAASNSVYGKMQQVLTDMGKTNYFVGTVEAKPGLEDVLEAVNKGEYDKVVLRPLMIVAGDHAHNDMASDEEDSWKTAFEQAGYDTECVLEGLGQLEPIQELFVQHAQEAMEELE